MKRSGTGAAGVALALLCAAGSAAGQQPVELDTLVVTASRRPQRLADAPVATEVVTRREIERARVADLSTLLTERLGIQLEGGHPAGEGVMLQGLGSERVLILMDGQPVVGRLSGTIDLSRIPTSMVERVEVVKGPQSSLYGSDAMGGVVNIITRTAPDEGWTGGVSVVAGSQGRADGSVSAGGTMGGVRYLADVGRRSTELAPGRASADGALAERWDALVKLGWAPRPGLSLEASALRLDERQRWRDGQIFHFADNLQWGARLGGEWVGEGWRLAPTLHLSQFEHLARRATAPEPVDGTGERELQRLAKGEILFSRGLGESALDLGVEATREEIVSDRVTGGERTLHTVEPFAQATWAVRGWRIVPSARLAWSEQWGTNLTPRLAALYRPVEALALRASVGRGYRAPAFKETAMEFLNVGPGFGYVVRGNPDLGPERSTNLSLGAEWGAGPLYLRTQAFLNRFDDFIETRLAGDSSGISVYTYRNVDEGYTRGAELEGGLALGRLRAEGGYAFLQAVDGESDLPLLGRPRHSGRLSVEHPAPLGFAASLAGVYTGATPVERLETEAREREGFLRLDLRLARPLPGGVDLSLGARNLLDARPDGWPGYAGRHLYLGLGWNTSSLASSRDTNR